MSRHVRVRLLPLLLVVLLIAVLSISLLQVTAQSAVIEEVVLTGSLQAASGCSGSDAECEATRLTYLENGDIWSIELELPAGEYEYRAALNGSLENSVGVEASADGASISLSLDQTSVVRFLYDAKTNWITDSVNSTLIVAVGDFQAALGCSQDEDALCLRTRLQDEDENGVYSFTTTDLAPGDYSVRVAVGPGGEAVYGAGGAVDGEAIAFTVPEAGFRTTIGFSPSRNLLNVRVVDPNAAAVAALAPTATPAVGITGLFVTVPGSYQNEIGCPDDSGAEGDWAPDCTLSQMVDPEDDGIYTFVVSSIPAGSYEAKVAVGGSWSENYGADGLRDGANIPFEVPVDFAQVTFTWDSGTKIVTIALDESVIGAPAQVGAMPIIVPAPVAEQPSLVVIPGSLQSVLGCPGDWAPDCEVTALTFDEVSGIWKGSFDLPAGNYEYKVALNGTWDVNFGGNADVGGPNIALNVPEDQTVSFYYDHGTNWVADSVRNVIASAPGSYQSEIGCAGDWAPECLRSWLQDPDGDGLYTFATGAIPAGDYEVKVALNESWALNYGLDGVQDGPNIPFNVPSDGTPVAFVFNSSTNILSVGVGTMPAAGPVAATPDLSAQKAHWVSRDTIAWDVADLAEAGATFKLFYAPEGGMEGNSSGFNGGTAIDLVYDPAGLSEEIVAQFPHLADLAALRIPAEQLDLAPGILRMQAGVVALDSAGQALDGTGLQIPGALDDIYFYDGPLGATFADGVPTLRVWAPTAQRVRLRLFDDANPDTRGQTIPMEFDRATGVWSVVGEADWVGKYYVYDIRVYAPSIQQIVNNLVTDPYSVSLSMNSTRSQIIDLNDPSTMPEGWMDLQKPPLDAPEDIVVYELHVRDFSMNDASVPDELRGTFAAFTVAESNGMQHLRGLAEAGLSHLHLLPTFDIATINEDAAQRSEPDPSMLATFPPDSEEQQALVNAVRDADGFNWGYDPYHFNVPEGSYSTNPADTTRILEFREMVAALNEAGLRVVIDVVYNHTNSAGQSDRSVFDKIVPGYYHRLNGRGLVETSTCCQNTATEHRMMQKFMVDSVLLWATAYKVDAFRFDLMGHHMRENMEEVRAALDALTIEDSGVDGPTIYVYGEGWNFGEVADNARGVNATQQNMAGIGIGTFNDRLRDAVRGGSPFGDRDFQGFVSGLALEPNGLTAGTPDEQMARLLLFADQIRVGLAGNLRDYTFIGANGETVSGVDVIYGGSPVGYTEDPQEQIVYISKHDNETIWDILLYKQLDISVDEVVRMNNLGQSIVMFSQGIPFFHAGDDLLRSKSLDRNSYNSGDWFNRLDFTYQTNNFGVGLPMASDNQDRWDEIQPILADRSRDVSNTQIMNAMMNFRELLQIRRSTPLFRLRTGEDIRERLSFHNVGPDQLPGLIVMAISDSGDLSDLDPNHEMVLVLFNARNETVSFSDAAFEGMLFSLHPVQSESHDVIVREASYDPGSNSFSVPARSYAVFVVGEGG